MNTIEETTIADFEKQNKAFQLAIPTPEHYVPLIILWTKEKTE
jgi:4,5-DOPA dioxygenase extradiol